MLLSCSRGIRWFVHSEEMEEEREGRSLPVHWFIDTAAVVLFLQSEEGSVDSPLHQHRDREEAACTSPIQGLPGVTGQSIPSYGFNGHMGHYRNQSHQSSWTTLPPAPVHPVFSLACPLPLLLCPALECLLQEKGSCGRAGSMPGIQAPCASAVTWGRPYAYPVAPLCQPRWCKAAAGQW